MEECALATLDYDGQPRGRPGWLPIVANVTAAYPLVALALLHFEWLCAWLVLGRRPVPSLDDPNGIAGVAILHGVVGLLFFGTPAAFVTAVVSTLMYVHDRMPSAAAGVSRLVAALIGLPVLIALLKWDPCEIAQWWID